MPAALMTREEVVDRLLQVFRSRGYDGASLALLSQETGLGKSSLYHYFPGGKEEMVEAVLDRVDSSVAGSVLAALSGPGTPKARLRRMVELLDEFYCGGTEGCILGSLVVGGALALFRKRLKRSFGAMIGAIAEVLVEAGQGKETARERAEDAMVRVQGGLLLAQALGDPRVFGRAVRRLPEELLANS